MLNFEEYKSTFDCYISKSDFDALSNIPVDLNAIELLTLVDKRTKEKREFFPSVRCKDCKHFFDDGTDNVAIYKCELLHEKMRDDFFCADGERRMNDDPHT